MADGLGTFLVAAFAASQPVTDHVTPCVLAISMTSSVDPGATQVGDRVDFSYTVSNPGTVALTDVQVESALPVGLSFEGASSGGAIDSDTGFVAWALSDGLAAGASTTLAVSATVTDPGQWLNNACSAGQDASGNEVTDCTGATVVTGTPILTPTPTPTNMPTLEATATATLTASPVPTSTSAPAATATPQFSPTPTT